MNRPPIKLVFMGLALAVLAALTWMAFGSSSRAPSRTDSLPREEPREPEASGAAAASSEVEPVVVPRPESASNVTSAPARASGATTLGRVRDLEGRPVIGVSVGLAAGDADSRAESGEDGRFALHLPAVFESGAAVVAFDDDWTTVRSGVAGIEGLVAVVTVAPRGEVRGVVVDRASRPLSGVDVRLELDGAAVTGLRELLGASERITWRASTTGEGRFSIPDAPRVPGRVEVVASHADYRASRVAWSAADERGMRIVLEDAPEPWTIFGKIVDPSGRFVSGAQVSLESAQGFSDPKGQFRLRSRRPVRDPEPAIAVRARGFLPARERIEAPRAGELRSGLQIRLARALTIYGHVFDASGQPVQGCIVRPFVAGEEQLVDVDFGPHASRLHAKRNTTTRRDGAFELTGLAAGSYVLHAFSRRLGLEARSEPVAAGTSGTELRLDAPRRQLVRGRVLDEAGQPLAGAAVTVRIPSAEGLSLRAQRAMADADGRVEWSGLPESFLELHLEAGGFLPSVQRFDASTGEEFTLRARPASLLEFTSSAEQADVVTVLNASGARERLFDAEDTQRGGVELVSLRDGRSGPLLVSRGAQTLVVYRSGQEVARLPLALDAGTSRVQWP